MITFTLTLLIYALLSGRSPFPRLGYAAFVSVIPAIAAWFIVYILRLLSRWSVVAIYFLLLIVTVVVQGWLR